MLKWVLNKTWKVSNTNRALTWIQKKKKAYLQTSDWQQTNESQWTQTWVFVVFQLLTHVQLFANPKSAAHQTSLSFTISLHLLKLKPIESVIPFSHLLLCYPLILLPSIFPSLRVFSSEFTLHMRWPKYWRLSFNISSYNEYWGLISFKMDWLDLLAVQGTLKSLIQHHSS